jgi:hypothetical protein
LYKLADMSCVLHINGWPGSGKRTIGAIVAAQIGGRLLDNHAMLNPAEALFERQDPLHASLYNAVRVVTLDHAAWLAPGVSIVLTDPLSDDEADTNRFDDFRRLAARRSAQLMAVVLGIAPEENIRRLLTPGRSEHRKLMRPEVLRQMRERYRLLRPAEVEVLDLDITHLTADEAAAQILEWMLHRSWSG